MLNPKKLNEIENRQQLIDFLAEENNSYSNFILERILRDPRTLHNIKTQVHHIIPLHCKGPDQAWNLITLTIEEHAIAHQLLYENYNTLQDLGAAQMIRGQVSKGLDTIRQLARQTMKRKNISFYNSDIQRELARRPKKQRKPYARNKYIVAALDRGFDLEHKTGKVLKIKPGECSSLVAVMDKLMLQPEMQDKRQGWDQCEQKEKYSGLTALTRTLTGHKQVILTTAQVEECFLLWVGEF